MNRSALFLLGCLLFLGLTPATAQDFMTLRNVTMLDDDKSSLTSEKKEKMAMSVSGRGFVGSIFLPPQTPVKILSRNSFTTRESVGTLAKQVNRSFNVALIEVLDGDHKGSKGWAVIDVQDDGRSKTVYIAQGSAPTASSGATTAESSADSVDLVAHVGAGHISPTGGRLYEVGVSNKGGMVHKGSVEVVVEMDGKVVKTERLRGPIAPNQVVSFTFPVSDTQLRKGVKITVTADPKNTIKEANRSNNSATTTARP